MQNFEKTIIILFLISAVTMHVVGQFDLEPRIIGLIAAYLTVGTMIGLCCFYLTQTTFSAYTFAFVLLAFEPIGGLFSLQHWPAGPFYIIGLLSALIIAVLLIKTVLENRIVKNGRNIFNTVIAGVLIVQIIAAYPALHEFMILKEGLEFLLLGVILTMKLKDVVLKLPESRVLTIVALQSTLFIIAESVSYFK